MNKDEFETIGKITKVEERDGALPFRPFGKG